MDDLLEADVVPDSMTRHASCSIYPQNVKKAQASVAISGCLGRT
jgi:hypothetical protein